jgi:hypothetical protein
MTDTIIISLSVLVATLINIIILVILNRNKKKEVDPFFVDTWSDDVY